MTEAECVAQTTEDLIAQHGRLSKMYTVLNIDEYLNNKDPNCVNPGTYIGIVFTLGVIERELEKRRTCEKLV